MKLLVDSLGKEVDGANPSPFGEEKFMICFYAAFKAWSRHKNELESLPDLDSQIALARAAGTGGDSRYGRLWMGIE
jgi:hypothetical protein